MHMYEKKWVKGKDKLLIRVKGEGRYKEVCVCVCGVLGGGG